MNRSDIDSMKSIEKKLGHRGTTLIEYGLILLLVAIVVIVAIKIVGGSTNNLFSIANSEISKAGPK